MEKETIKFEEKQKRLVVDTLNYLSNRGLETEDIISLINKKLIEKQKIKPEIKDIEIPLNIFKNDHLSALETIVKFLRENMMFSFKQIATMTNRNPVALAVSYRNARNKMKDILEIRREVLTLPLNILQDRRLSVLENIVKYLKEELNLTYHQIAVMLNRNDRTIWTIYSRVKIKVKI